MKIVSITVNYKTPELTIRAIQSELADLRDLGGQIIVVDNDSQDESFEYISKEVASRGWSGIVKVVKTPRNGGFGYGINFASETTLERGEKPDYFFLLGPDATVDQGSLTRLVAFMDANPHVGLAGSKTCNTDGSPRVSAFRFPGVLSELEEGLRLGICSRVLARWTVRRPIPQKTTEVDWVSAASMIIRRKVLEQVGMFDESFFLYFEETDLCRRSKLAGWPNYYVIESTATHVGQVSTGINDVDRPRSTYWFASRRHYFVKHHGISYLWCANVVYILSHLLWRIRRGLQGKQEMDPPHFLRDFLRHSFWPPEASLWFVGTSRESIGAHRSKSD